MTRSAMVLRMEAWPKHAFLVRVKKFFERFPRIKTMTSWSRIGWMFFVAVGLVFFGAALLFAIDHLESFFR
jgi:hypothetical protein